MPRRSNSACRSTGDHRTATGGHRVADRHGQDDHASPMARANVVAPSRVWTAIHAKKEVE
jgi:hypothetical protein